MDTKTKLKYYITKLLAFSSEWLFFYYTFVSFQPIALLLIPIIILLTFFYYKIEYPIFPKELKLQFVAYSILDILTQFAVFYGGFGNLKLNKTIYFITILVSHFLLFFILNSYFKKSKV